MANVDLRVGLDAGPDLRICSGDGVQDKAIKLDANGNVLLGGVRIGDSLKLIEAQTTSAVSVTDYVTGLTTAYSKLVLQLDDWEPATDGGLPEILLSTDAGSTWAEAAGSYAWLANGARAGNFERAGSDSDTKIQLVTVGVSNVAGEGLGGSVIFHGAKSATSRCTLEWAIGHFDVSTRLYGIIGHAKRLADEDITGIRVQADAGNHSVVSALWGVLNA